MNCIRSIWIHRWACRRWHLVVLVALLMRDLPRTPPSPITQPTPPTPPTPSGEGRGDGQPGQGDAQAVCEPWALGALAGRPAGWPDYLRAADALAQLCMVSAIAQRLLSSIDEVHCKLTNSWDLVEVITRKPLSWRSTFARCCAARAVGQPGRRGRKRRRRRRQQRGRRQRGRRQRGRRQLGSSAAAAWAAAARAAHHGRRQLVRRIAVGGSSCGGLAVGGSSGRPRRVRRQRARQRLWHPWSTRARQRVRSVVFTGARRA
jgi:hypothetical protein